MAPRAVLDGDVIIREGIRRHRNLRVECTAGPSYFIKAGAGADGIAAVDREAAVYRALAAADGALADIAPRLAAHDPGGGLLVLDLTPGAQDLRRLHERVGAVPASVAAAIGRALGVLHRARGWEGAAPSPAPWALAAHRPPLERLRDLSNGAVQAIRVVQSDPSLPGRLDALRAGWRADALVHGDVKWDNVVVALSPRPGDPATVRLVDWELAGAGDQDWDVGSALAAHLTAWLVSIPSGGDADGDRLLASARHPLAPMRPAIAALWDGYREARCLTPDEARARVPRAVELAGVRLVQTALESAQTTDRLTGGVVLHLQVAANLLARPRDAAAALLGLSAEEGGGG